MYGGFAHAVTRWLPRALAAWCRRRASAVAHTPGSTSPLCRVGRLRVRTAGVPSHARVTPSTRKSASEVRTCSKMRIIEERTKVKDSDNQLNNSALSGAEFATFHAKLRQKRVKSPKNRKNAKSAKKSRKRAKGAKSGQLPAQVALEGTPARMRRSRRRGRRTPEAAERTRVVWLRCAKVGTCTCGAGTNAVAAHDGCHAA